MLGAEHAKAGVGVGLVQLQQLLGDLEEGILDTWQHTFCITASVLRFSTLSLATHLLHYRFSIVLLYSITGNTPALLLQYWASLLYHWQHTCITASVLCFSTLSLATHLLHYRFSIVLLYSITGNTPSALPLQYWASLLYHWQHTCIIASVLCFSTLSLATHLHYCFSIVLYSITGNTPSALPLQDCASLLYHWQHTFCITASVLCFSTLSLATHLLHYRFSIVLLYSITGNTPALPLQYCASLLYHWQHTCIIASVLCFSTLSLATHLHYCFSIVLLYSITGNTPSALPLQYCASPLYHWQHTFCIAASVLCFSTLSLATHLHYCFSIVLYSITGNTPSALLLQYCASLLYHWQHTFCITASVLCFSTLSLATHLHYCFSIVLLYSITGNTPALLLQYCASLLYHWQHTFCITASVLCFSTLSLATHLLHYRFSIVLLYSITGNTPALLLQYCASLLYHWQHTCIIASVLCFSTLSLATHLLHYRFSIVLLHSITGNTPSALPLQYCASLLYHWQHTCIIASVLCFSTLSLATHLHYCFSIVLYSITGNTPFALLLQYCALFYHWQHTFCITASVLCFSLLSLATHFLHYYFSIALLSMYQNHWQHSFYTNRFCAGLLSSFILSDAKQLLHYWFGIVLLSSFFLSDAKQFLLTDQYCTSFFRLSVSITGNTASTVTDSV